MVNAQVYQLTSIAMVDFSPEEITSKKGNLVNKNFVYISNHTAL